MRCFSHLKILPGKLVYFSLIIGVILEWPYFNLQKPIGPLGPAMRYSCYLKFTQRYIFQVCFTSINREMSCVCVCVCGCFIYYFYDIFSTSHQDTQDRTVKSGTTGFFFTLGKNEDLNFSHQEFQKFRHLSQCHRWGGEGWSEEKTVGLNCKLGDISCTISSNKRVWMKTETWRF